MPGCELHLDAVGLYFSQELEKGRKKKQFLRQILFIISLKLPPSRKVCVSM